MGDAGSGVGAQAAAKPRSGQLVRSVGSGARDEDQAGVLVLEPDAEAQLVTARVRAAAVHRADPPVGTPSPVIDLLGRLEPGDR